jgi:hypothetical protein
MRVAEHKIEYNVTIPDIGIRIILIKGIKKIKVIFIALRIQIISNKTMLILYVHGRLIIKAIVNIM